MTLALDPQQVLTQLQVGPIHGAGAPMNALAPQHAAAGWIEQEFRISGSATRYRLTDPAADAEPIDAGHRYTTRLLIRRPNEAVRFSGTVVVEWLNVSTGQDLDFVYAATRELIVRAGHAWVGVMRAAGRRRVPGDLEPAALRRPVGGRVAGRSTERHAA